MPPDAFDLPSRDFIPEPTSQMSPSQLAAEIATLKSDRDLLRQRLASTRAAIIYMATNPPPDPTSNDALNAYAEAVAGILGQ